MTHVVLCFWVSRFNFLSKHYQSDTASSQFAASVRLLDRSPSQNCKQGRRFSAKAWTVLERSCSFCLPTLGLFCGSSETLCVLPSSQLYTGSRERRAVEKDGMKNKNCILVRRLGGLGGSVGWVSDS